MTVPATPPSSAPAIPANPTARRHRIRNRIIAGAAVVLLILGSIAAWALDRFVIAHVEISDVAAYDAQQATSTDATAASGGTTAGTASASSSTESSGTTTDGADITVTEHTYGSGDDAATYYVADITLDDITQLRSAFANNEFGTNIIDEPSSIAADVGASLAINGDYYGFRDTGIVIRNGVIYRDEPARQGAVIYADGTMEIYEETETSAQELVDAGAWMTLSFGPALVADGAIVDGIESVEVDTNVGNHSIQGDQPRTAIGMIDANHYVLVVVDGRSDSSAGVTLTELAEMMQDLGATQAYNLDGGGSSTMVSDGQVVNWPGGKGEERGTSDILWVG